MAAKRCKDCDPNSKRPAPHPGPRCSSHHREVVKARKERDHERHLAAKYGLTAKEYRDIWFAQGGHCAVCERANGSTKRLAVEHNHKTGEIRSLCCGPCNQLIGHLRDDPNAFRRAADILENPIPRKVFGGPRYVPR